jgi:crotonobetainyl-CoA:carnitine CoA-transferase CaiB-like acyl-CoA transferase
MTKAPSSALAHLRILDLTRVRAGPTCCRVLADFGADVIKIEPPDGASVNDSVSDERLGYDMQNLHRNKRSLTLNLKIPEGRTVFMRLVETADAVVENYRPDVKERLGIGYHALRAVNPRIILASISGFGQQGPYRDRACFDQIAQGMGGLMWVTGLPGQGPVRAGIAVADSAAGLYAVTGIFIALAEREKSGLGQWVQTSLLEAQIALCDFQAARYLVDHVVPPQAGNDHPFAAPMGAVQTQDGYINIAVGNDRQWKSLCHALDRPALAEDPDYASKSDRSGNRSALVQMLAPIFRAHISNDLLSKLEAHDVPAGPIYRMDEVFADPQVQHLGIAQTVHRPKRGYVQLVGQPVTLSRTPSSISTPIPDKGAHTDEVLLEAGFHAEEIAHLREIGVI